MRTLFPFLLFACFSAIFLAIAFMLSHITTPEAHIERIDKDGIIWVQLNNISDNATIYLYYGDKVNSKAFWILK